MTAPTNEDGMRQVLVLHGMDPASAAAALQDLLPYLSELVHMARHEGRHEGRAQALEEAAVFVSGEPLLALNRELFLQLAATMRAAKDGPV